MRYKLKNVQKFSLAMQNWVEKNFLVGAVVMSTALIGIAWFGLAGPTLAEAQDMQEQRRQLQQRVDKLEVLAQSESTIDVKKLRHELQLAESVLPKKPDLTGIAQEISQQAETEGLTVSALRIPEKGAGKRHAKLKVEFYQIDLELRGGYHGLVRFVHKLEERYGLKQVSIEGEKNGIVRAEMNVLIAGEV